MKTSTLLLFLLFTGMLHAQLFDESLQSSGSNEDNKSSVVSINGYSKTSAFLNSDIKELSHTFAEMALLLRTNTGPATLRADIRLRNGISNGSEYWQIEPKELYAGLNTKHFDLTAGYQIVSWGKTDGFNPTDNLSPKNYFFLSEDPNDQLMSNLMLRSKIRPLSNVEIELIGIPFYKSSVYHYDWFDLGDNVVFNEAIHPEKLLENSTLAAKLNLNTGYADASVSWFRGFDLFHGFAVQEIDWSGGFPLIYNAAQSYLKTSWGADIAIPLKRQIFRMEMARNITENPDDKMHIPLSDWSYVGAIEKTISGVTMIAQYIGKYVPGFTALTVPVLTDPLNPLAQMQYANAMIMYENRLFNQKIFHQQEKLNHAVSLTMSGNFAYETWNIECTAYHNFTSNEWLIRPAIKYFPIDGMQISVGANYMLGEDKSLFDYASKIMNGLFAGIKVNF